MIQAAPFILPIAEALGLSVATLGMAKVTDEVNKYIQENPEQAQKLIATIMPAQGIASMFENKKRGIGDNNPPSPIEEEKPPQQEPPEGEPDLLPELTKHTAEEVIRKQIKEKEGTYFPKEKEDPTSNLYKTVNKAQHRFLMDSISEYTENISKGTIDKVNKLLYLNEKVTFTDKQLRELNNAIGDKRQLDFDLANKKNWDDVDEDLDLSIKENAEMLNTVTEQEYLDLMQKLKNPKKIIKKATGGLIDKPLTGGSRYI